MHRFRLAIFAAALNAAAAAAAGTQASAPAPIEIKLIGLNDFHGYITPPNGTVHAPDLARPSATVELSAGGSAYVASLLRRLEAGNPLHAAVAAGDLIGASPLVSALFHDEPTIESLNLMGLDAASVGNHEFDKGQGELRRMQNGGCHPQGKVGVDTCILHGRFSGASFRYLAANVVDDRSGHTLFPAYWVKRFKQSGRSVKLAFIGLTLQQTPSVVSPSGIQGLSFADEADTVNKLVPILRRQGVESIVVLIHQGGAITGLYNDQACPGFNGDILPIVNRLDAAVDIVISGHTHQAYICKAKAADGAKDILITSAGDYGRFLTDIDIRIDPRSRDIVAVQAQNLAVVNDLVPPPAGYTALAADPQQNALIATYSALSAPLANAVIGTVIADITRVQSSAGESALGDVIADAQLAATAPDGFGNAVAALMNPGGIRADFLYAAQNGGEAPGQVVYGEAFKVQPFYNTLVTMTLTGTQLKTLLEQQFDNPAVGQQRVLQVSKGFSYRWDDRQPSGSKVIAGTMRIGSVAVDPVASYRITVNSFLAGGGDKFTVLKEGQNRLGGALDIDALQAYFRSSSAVAPGSLDRITRGE